MRKFFVYAAMALAMTATVACSSDSNGEIDYIPVKVESDGDWGMLGADGKMLFDNEFKYATSSVVEGLFLAKEGNGLTLYKAQAAPVPLSGEYENLIAVGLPSEGKIVVLDKDYNCFVASTADGAKKFTLPTDIVLCHASFMEGLLGVVNKNAKWGYVDETGKQVIPCKYDGISAFSEGFAVVASIANDKTALQIINTKGETVARVKNTVRLASDEPKFVNGRIPAVNADGQYGFVTTEGNFEKCSSKVKSIGKVADGRFIFSNADKKYGCMDFNGNILIQPRYEELNFIPKSDKFLARVNTTYSLINAKGEKEREFSEYQKMHVGIGTFPIFATPGKTWEILNKEGNPLTQETFAQVGAQNVRFNKEFVVGLKDLDLSLVMEIQSTIKSLFNRFDQVSSGDSEQSPASFFDFEALSDSLDSANLQLNAIIPEEADLTDADGEDMAYQATPAQAQSGVQAATTQYSNPYTWLSMREVTYSDVAHLSKKELRLMRNAIYAMHGHVFKSDDLRKHFSQFAWYIPVGDASAKLSKLEKANVAFIQSYE